MKLSAFRNKEPKFTADLWGYTTVTGPDAVNTRTFHFSRAISFNAVTGNFGKIDVFFQDTESDVRAFDQLINFKGPDGNPMFPNSVYQVEMVAPFINIWGRREGFRARIAFFGLTGG